MKSPGTIRIKGARAYDPSQEWRGEIRDLFVKEGRISEPFEDPEQTIDAGGRLLLAGGIDPHCQLAVHGQSLTRLLLDTPSAEEIGRAYARMGYVHVHQPFTTLLTARLVRHALNLIPFVDTSTCVSIDLRDMGQSIRANRAVDFCSLGRALIKLSGAVGLSLPFPYLRHQQRHYIQKNLSAKKVLSFLSLIDDPEILPLHIWGMPGVLDTEIPNPGNFHVAGLGMALDSEAAVERAGGFLEAGGSADLGLNTGQKQLVVSADSTMRQASLSLDLGLQTPLAMHARTIPLDHSITLAGWSLLKGATPDCRLALGASGPAGGQFEGMPQVTTWLVEPQTRPDPLPEVLADYTLDPYEWALRTRLEPARSIGLADLGHLQSGARANLVLYDLQTGGNPQQTQEALSQCWCLIKDGVLVREDGAFSHRRPPTEIRSREVDTDLSGLTQTDLLQNATLRFEHLDARLLADGRVEGP
jgi:formylmethanofuran dehydrogenase subunit A